MLVIPRASHTFGLSEDDDSHPWCKLFWGYKNCQNCLLKWVVGFFTGSLRACIKFSSSSYILSRHSYAFKLSVTFETYIHVVFFAASAGLPDSYQGILTRNFLLNQK